MKLARGASGRLRPKTLGFAAFIACFLLPCIFVFVIRPNFDPSSIWNLQLSVRASVQLQHIQAVHEDATHSHPSGNDMRNFPWALEIDSVNNEPESINVSAEVIIFPVEKIENKSLFDTGIISLPVFDEKIKNQTVIGTQTAELLDPILIKQQRGKESTTGTQTAEPDPILIEQQREKESTIGTIGLQQQPVSEEKKDQHNSVTGKLEPESKLVCDLSQRRSDTCMLKGDVRVLGQFSSIILASPSESDATLKIRPYARKWEPQVMETIKELTLRSFVDKPEESPRCAVNHSIPAIIFSTGGFLGNFFHDFTDLIIPLFITSRQYQGEVQFLVTDFNYRWINKYHHILKQLSRHEIVNLDRDGKVHCFPQAQVGLTSNKELGVDPSKSPNGYSMADFRELLMSSFSLKRRSIRPSDRRRRLLIMLRKGSRSFTNKRQVVGLGRSLGFKVVVAGPEETKNMSRFSRIVNSCDVMIGVHGAGLTNMMFLPTGAAMVQIVPWGGLKWACWHDFGEPAPDMGITYLEYEIREEESSLIKQYPRDHPVFTDPLSIQRQGWNTLWSVFLDKQKVTLDVRRFKPVLLEALQSLH